MDRCRLTKVHPMKFFVCAIALLLAMSGCAVYTPAGSVVIDPAGPHGHGGSGGNGSFCPPGQAKKGNC